MPIDYDYFDFEGGNYVWMIGRDGKGEKICVVDSYDSNFWIILKKEFEGDASKVVEKIKNVKFERDSRTSEVLNTKVVEKNFLGHKVKAIQVFVTNHKDAHAIASEIGDMKEIENRREYDVPLISKYIKEKDILPLQWYEIEVENLGVDDLGGFGEGFSLKKIFRLKSSKKIEGPDFLPLILAYDIETEGMDATKSSVLSISLYSKGYKKVLTWKKCKGAPDYVETLKNEGEMIEKFVEEVHKFDPDILVGYFSDGFDLPFLKTAADREKVDFNLGLDGKDPKFSRGRIPVGKIAGIVHVDAYRFIRSVFAQYMQSETLGLNDVAKELVGEEKEDFDFKKLANMKDSDWKELFSYNLQDSKITYDLTQKILPDLYEFTKITKEPLFDTCRASMSSHVESYLIHNLDKFNEIIEKKPIGNDIGERRSYGKYEGAFVMEPIPGLYENIVMFDFTSMYASVIVTYNLSKSTFNGKEFSKDEGFFPILLKDLIEKRKAAKKEFAKDSSAMAKARSNAYKLLANASYGYQGFFGARYYSREAAAATAKMARENIHAAMKKIKDSGYKIIYSDTDSIAFLQDGKKDSQILELLEEVNKKLPGIMELDLEDFYSRGIFVTPRSGIGGAKKKYALIDRKGKLKIRGFETVRRDWCTLTRRLQSQILEKILKDGKIEGSVELLKKVVKDLKNRKIALSDLMIRTQIKKGVSDYLSTGPHVVAAKKMMERGEKVTSGMLIYYFIGEVNGKTKRIGDKVFLPDEKADYNIDYYLNNQVLPAVENIFDVFGVDVREILDGGKNSTLSDFK